jgi:hypothetical protein
METLKWSDQRRIAEFARDLYSSGSIKATSERLVLGLVDLIGGNSVWWLVIASDQEHRLAAINAALNADITQPSWIVTKVSVFGHQ